MSSFTGAAISALVSVSKSEEEHNMWCFFARSVVHLRCGANLGGLLGAAVCCASVSHVPLPNGSVTLADAWLATTCAAMVSMPRPPAAATQEPVLSSGSCDDRSRGAWHPSRSLGCLRRRKSAGSNPQASLSKSLPGNGSVCPNSAPKAPPGSSAHEASHCQERPAHFHAKLESG